MNPAVPGDRGRSVLIFHVEHQSSWHATLQPRNWVLSADGSFRQDAGGGATTGAWATSLCLQSSEGGLLATSLQKFILLVSYEITRLHRASASESSNPRLRTPIPDVLQTALQHCHVFNTGSIATTSELKMSVMRNQTGTTSPSVTLLRRE
jgi:hypothetical protein